MLHLVALVPVVLSDLPEVRVTRDDTRIDRSCRIVIAEGVVITDTNRDGVIHIAADGIEIEFAPGTVLRGAGDDVAGDTLEGFGVRVQGRKGVTIRNAEIRGFRGGIFATDAHDLTIHDVAFSNIRRHRLRSTPAAEDGGDWLWPHNNDDNQWLTNYGAALYIEDSSNATIRNVRVRHAQNGIALDRVTNSRVYDNDASFLSGWGLAMWRSSDNTVTRNAFDFCVRGYSHGVYNRGQDSAGILFFEQNNRNLIAENSCTHGGDGIFGFGGREALGELAGDRAKPGEFARRGCNDNLFIANDLSYAPAHGLELTFSFGNLVARNRMAGNAICGIWGGYSQETLITDNVFEANGDMGYGLERGGVNIEHGRNNVIVGNAFKSNKCGVHLWWDNDEGFRRLPWGKDNDHAESPRFIPSIGNVIVGNTFEGDQVAVHLRECDPTVIAKNTYRGVGRELDASASEVLAEARPLEAAVPDYTALGNTRPVGSRNHLRGRENIIMTEWGPWDHESPLVRRGPGRSSSEQSWDVFGVEGKVDFVLHPSPGVSLRTVEATGSAKARAVVSAAPGVHPYTLEVRAAGFSERVRGTIIAAEWDVKVWTWKANPLEDLEAWRKEADGPGVLRAKVSAIDFPFAMGGPRNVGISPEISAAESLTSDRFSIHASTRVPLRRGTWKVSTLSDDGVRVFIDGKMVIERWDIHGPTKDTAEFEVVRNGPVEIRIEHFENNGYAVLSLDLEPIGQDDQGG